MNRTQLDEIVSTIAVSRYGVDNDITRSKSLAIYSLHSMMENLYGYSCEDDIVSSITDAPYDRELDAIYYDDCEEQKVTCYLVQIKYSSEDRFCITYEEAAAFVESCKMFPNIKLRKNNLVAEKAEQYKLYRMKEYEIEKKNILIGTGKIDEGIKEYLQDNHIEVYSFDKLNSQVFLDEYLPNVELRLIEERIRYDENTLLGVLDVGQMVRAVDSRQCIDNQSLFAYNVRGKMATGKRSIARQIERTCKESPKELFRKNNGITIVCNDFSNEGNVFCLTKASVVNGQQTIRAIRNIYDDICPNSLYLAVKILKLKGNDEENKKQIIELAESANRQNSVKDSDLITNEEEQRLIYKEAIMLPHPLQFIYKFKRDFSTGKRELSGKLIITKEEATNYIYSFMYANPNDRADDVMKQHYDKIFNDRSAKEIRIIHLIRNRVLDSQINTNEILRKSWNEKYDKFKKDRVVNFCMYIFSLILSESYDYKTPQKKKELIKKIYTDMCKNKNYDMIQYFNKDFWNIHNTVCQRLLTKYYSNPELTADHLRKPLADLKEFTDIYTQVVYDLSNLYDINPKILI